MPSMNNVICIFVDSVSWNSVGTNRAKISPTPFIDSLKTESITATNLYSHGPYTDAAKRSLFTGRNCLDDFGYYFKMNTSPISDFKLFHDAGYETYGFYYPFFMFGDNVKKYIDHSIYTAGFVFGSEWNGIFKYYSEKIQTQQLNKIEKNLLVNRVNLLFDVFANYLMDLKTRPISSSIYKKCLEGYDIDNAIKTLNNEKTTYLEDRVKYVEQLLIQGKDHFFWKLDPTRIDSIIDGDFLQSIVKEHRRFFYKIIKNNTIANLFRLMPTPKRTFWGVKRYFTTKDSKELMFWRKYRDNMAQFFGMMRRWDKPYWQNDSSIHSILSAGIDVLKNRKDTDKPVYMNLNTDDPHSFLAMFDYTCQDRNEVNEQISVLENYADELGTNFKGSLLYLLSLRYVDYEIERFCKKLKEYGLWENTTLIIISDHGSSFTYSPLHNNSVNGFDDECYHIPVLLRHPGFKGLEITTYQNSKDIYPTVCDLVGIPQSPHFKGHSMLDKTILKKPYVMTEYMGPGCPDMTSRRMWLSIRDEKYVIAYKVGIYEEFEDGELAECYNLSKDPNAYYNINFKIDKNEIAYLMRPLKERYETIKRDTCDFIRKIEEKEIVLPI